MKNRFLLPWQITFTVTCAQCGGKVECHPLWHWEKTEDKARELQPRFCHKLDSAILKQIPVLSENDWVAKQKWEEFQKEFTNEHGQIKSPEALKPLLSTEKGPPEIFLRHGIFPLLQSFTQTELKMLFLALCLDSGCCFRQTFYLDAMRISRTYVSTILKKFISWRLLIRGRPNAKGRARGRQLAYMLDKEARRILENDLSELEFFRNAVKATVRPVALCFSELQWRKDLGLLDREK